MDKTRGVDTNTFASDSPFSASSSRQHSSRLGIVFRSSLRSSFGTTFKSEMIWRMPLLSNLYHAGESPLCNFEFAADDAVLAMIDLPSLTLPLCR